MNKLMIAAAMALTMGIYANASDCNRQPDDNPPSCALVYNLSINVKTTIAKPGKAVKVSVCEREAEAKAASCYRVKSSKSFKGVVYVCDCGCDSLEGLKAVIWNVKDKTVFEGDFALNPFWRINKNNNVLEMGWKFEDDPTVFDAQGFGTWKNGRMQNANGNLIGWLEAPWYISKKPLFGEEGEDCECQAFPYDCLGVLVADVPTIAFGSWNLKYNAKASKAYDADGSLPVPAWVDDGSASVY